MGCALHNSWGDNGTSFAGSSAKVGLGMRRNKATDQRTWLAYSCSSLKMMLQVGARMGDRKELPAQTSFNQSKKAQSLRRDCCRFRKTSTKSCQALKSFSSLLRASKALVYAFIGRLMEENEGWEETALNGSPKATLIDFQLLVSSSNNSGLTRWQSDLRG